MSRSIVTTLAVLATLFLGACSSETGGDSPAGSSVDSSADTVAASAQSLPRPPLSEYVDARALSEYALGSWMEYWLLGNTPWIENEEKILELTSERHVNTNDAFARRDFREEELAKARPLLEQFRGKKHIVVRWGRDSMFEARDFFAINSGTAGAYNFDTLTFPGISRCDTPKKMEYRARGGFSVYLEEKPGSTILCQVRVTDMELAKKVEELRPRDHLDFSGELYLDLTEAVADKEGSYPHIEASIRAMSFEIWNRRTGELLGTIPADPQ